MTAVDGTATATATLTVTAGPAATVSAVSGGQQTAAVGAAFTSPLIAQVTDVYGNPVPGTPVTFTLPPLSATAGAATFPGATTIVTVTSNAAGAATSPVITGTRPGPVTATATAPAATGATYTLAVTATGPARADLAITLTAPTQAHLGSTTTVAVTVTDNGPSAATKVATAVTIPAGWTVTNPGGGTNIYHQVVLFVLPALATKTSVTYTVSYTVKRHPSTARITAVAFASTQDPNSRNITTSTTQIR